MLSRKAKEAIKTGLAFALVYAIALQADWLNPYWAGFAVVFISLQTAGESIHKGLNRLAGTIPGCIAAIIILSLSAQSRWVFMLLASAWVFFTAYMSLRSKNNTYLWTVAGFVCLVLIATGASTSEDLFEHLVFRLLETILGIIVYTLVSVFLWPLNNAGEIKKAGRSLMATQSAICHAGLKLMTGTVATGSTTPKKPAELHQQELEQLTRLAQSLVAEGSENYEVRELRSLWNRFHSLSTSLMESLDRWHSGMAELVRIDTNAVLPTIPAFFDELECRFEEIQRLLNGASVNHKASQVKLKINRNATRELSHFELAAVEVTRIELETIDTLTGALLDCALDLAGQPTISSVPQSAPVSNTLRPAARLPVVDLDNLRTAAYAALLVCIGFLVWVYADPPGHMGWFNMLGTMALVTIPTLQVPVIRFVKPLTVAFVLCLCVYVFIMPRLSTYFELGLLLFTCIFISRYFFSGIARAMASLAIINALPIENQQTYDFAMLANKGIFLIMLFLFLYALSHIMGAPRPEKKIVVLLRRFFRSTEFLMSSVIRESGGKVSQLERWKFAFYRHEMNSLPGKIRMWSKAIDQTRFSGNKPEQVHDLVTTLQGLMYRIENLLVTRATRQAETLAREMQQSVHAWRENIESLFIKWSTDPGSMPSTDLEQRLAVELSELEQRIDAAIEQADRENFSEEDGENFYRLLGAYRGVSEAAVAYAGIAVTIDWHDWKEEKF